MVKNINYILSIFLVLICIGCIYATQEMFKAGLVNKNKDETSNADLVDKEKDETSNADLVDKEKDLYSNKNKEYIYTLIVNWNINGVPENLEKYKHLLSYIKHFNNTSDPDLPVEFCNNIL
ncbi:uncharacterized protein LOC100575129 isoform X2 [Acyrthosiphon pisum]|uniref:Uncharacterized protein n=1 Tax=Acyrthosiphon pisum TaxID=7029 RepID=A0A8R2H5D3_ACYPI|nr:uncharacterized protein LOC100575129 isoform X2 [Acyrthosiphon pisum]|eukprot:XP_016656591.1 PREDICTED: uncharacterized protein LOC100575129 isoform X2 [Acyrthosiphon pisum]